MDSDQYDLDKSDKDRWMIGGTRKFEAAAKARRVKRDSEGKCESRKGIENIIGKRNRRYSEGGKR